MMLMGILRSLGFVHEVVYFDFKLLMHACFYMSDIPIGRWVANYEQGHDCAGGI